MSKWKRALAIAGARAGNRGRRGPADLYGGAVAVLWDEARGEGVPAYRDHIEQWQSVIRQYCALRRLGMASEDAWRECRPVTVRGELAEMGEWGAVLARVGEDVRE